jgi:hypothetical protein
MGAEPAWTTLTGSASENLTVVLPSFATTQPRDCVVLLIPPQSPEHNLSFWTPTTGLVCPDIALEAVSQKEALLCVCAARSISHPVRLGIDGTKQLQCSGLY